MRDLQNSDRPLPPDAQNALRELADIDRALATLGVWPASIKHTDQDGTPLDDQLTRAGTILLHLTPVSAIKSPLREQEPVAWAVVDSDGDPREANSIHWLATSRHAPHAGDVKAKAQAWADGFGYSIVPLYSAPQPGKEVAMKLTAAQIEAWRGTWNGGTYRSLVPELANAREELERPAGPNDALAAARLGKKILLDYCGPSDAPLLAAIERAFAWTK